MDGRSSQVPCQRLLETDYSTAALANGAFYSRKGTLRQHIYADIFFYIQGASRQLRDWLLASGYSRVIHTGDGRNHT